MLSFLLLFWHLFFVFVFLKFHCDPTKCDFIFLLFCSGLEFLQSEDMYLSSGIHKKDCFTTISMEKIKKKSCWQDVGRILINYQWEFVNNYNIIRVQYGNSNAGYCIFCAHAIILEKKLTFVEKWDTPKFVYWIIVYHWGRKDR